MAEQKISDILETSIEKIKTMVDANTIIGDKIIVLIFSIEVSRISEIFCSAIFNILLEYNL